MAAPKNNTYWQLVKGWRVGNDKTYTPDELWEKACEYFDWVEKNPLKEQKAFGSGYKPTVNKMRAMTQKAFCLFAQIGYSTFDRYDKDEAYRDITSRIKDIIFTQKFEGASADLLNSNIIARELGLSDKMDHTTKGESLNKTADLSKLTDEELRIRAEIDRKAYGS